MQVFFGTVNRSAPVRKGGEVVRLDWDTKKVAASVPVFPDNPSLDHDPNPRGNTRGCRGIAIMGGELVASTYHTVSVYDLNLRHVRDVSHGLMVGLHEVEAVGSDRLWVTSTALDAALLYDLRTGEPLESYWPRELDAVQQRFGVRPVELDKAVDQRALHMAPLTDAKKSHLHLNAVAHWRGRALGLFNRRGVIADLGTGEVLVEDPGLRGAHNLLVTDQDQVIANETLGHKVRWFDLESGQATREIDLTTYPFVRRLRQRAVLMNRARNLVSKTGVIRRSVSRPLFVRGLHVVGDLLFVGFSPATIVCIDLRTGELVDSYQHSSNVQSCIHGLTVLP